MPEDFRIALIGQAAFGENVLNALVENGEHVAGVFCPPDQEGRPPDPLKTAAQRQDVPVFQFNRLRDGEAVEAFRALAPDLGVMAFVTDIVPEEILTAPRLNTIQYHPSLLPRHRGPSSINWPIIQGETKTGLSIFWPDAGLDTGPILMQKEVAIEPDDTLGTVYFDKLFPLGVEAMVESVQQVKAGTAPKIEQDESQATYEGWCKTKDCRIDWSRPVDDVYNLIRGADPSPGAGSVLNGQPVQFFNASRQAAAGSSEPGAVLDVTGNGVLIAANGGALLIRRVRPVGGGKLDAAQWARENGIASGDRFGTG